MEDEKLTTWYFGGERPTPMLLYTAVAERFGLQNGSKIMDAGIYEHVIEANRRQIQIGLALTGRQTRPFCN